jgi:hypothetical protein
MLYLLVRKNRIEMRSVLVPLALFSVVAGAVSVCREKLQAQVHCLFNTTLWYVVFISTLRREREEGGKPPPERQQANEAHKPLLSPSHRR